MERRRLLSRLGLLPLLAGVSLSTRADETKKPLKIMFKSAWALTTRPRLPLPSCTAMRLRKLDIPCRFFCSAKRSHSCDPRSRMLSSRWVGRR